MEKQRRWDVKKKMRRNGKQENERSMKKVKISSNQKRNQMGKREGEGKNERNHQGRQLQVGCVMSKGRLQEWRET